MKLISKYIEDIFIFAGLGAITAATFMISLIAGIYVAGVALLGLGIFFAKHPR